MFSAKSNATQWRKCILRGKEFLNICEYGDRVIYFITYFISNMSPKSYFVLATLRWILCTKTLIDSQWILWTVSFTIIYGYRHRSLRITLLGKNLTIKNKNQKKNKPGLMGQWVRGTMLTNFTSDTYTKK